ncbi:hypothetical protein Bca52824_036529 [Brassica carinata]|uniref:Uncharacterized protein n=1 Tax=Brassica carinata TaxID=52824 RepID=A0A8X7S5H4_BRACI|nr:hypothetical protein Bca52824_036529 [Brassica carinata]
MNEKIYSKPKAEPATGSDQSRSLLRRECISLRRPSHRIRRQDTSSVPRELRRREPPALQELAVVDGGCGGEDGAIAVSCEVVLFEHLLWMLENADADESRPESVHELVEFYAY